MKAMPCDFTGNTNGIAGAALFIGRTGKKKARTWADGWRLTGEDMSENSVV